MNVHTRVAGKPVTLGSELEVDDRTAERWIARRIATAIEPSKPQQPSEPQKKAAKEDGPSWQDIRRRAAELGIKTHGRTREDLLEEIRKVEQALAQAQTSQPTRGQGQDPSGQEPGSPAPSSGETVELEDLSDDDLRGLAEQFDVDPEGLERDQLIAAIEEAVEKAAQD